MSRSKKKTPIIKDYYNTRSYWKTIRGEWKRDLKKFYTTRHIDDLSEYNEDHLMLRLPKEIHNDWDFIDYVWYLNTIKKNGNIITPMDIDSRALRK